MKSTIILNLFIIVSFTVFGIVSPQQAFAQDGAFPELYEQYSQAELAQMLAPIALYPDTLLSQVLMASTYPIEVIEADRWIARRPELKGERLDDALLNKDWDPSVKAICHFPSILALMSERISETTNIGNAFLAQEGEVMDMVQELRARAYAQGNLYTSARQNVVVDREIIIIEPSDPHVIYAPYYDPFAIYGTWWYPAYPPYIWHPHGTSYVTGFSYWPGINFGFTFTNWSYFDWHRHHVHIDVHKRPRYVRHDRWTHVDSRWNHSPTHRRGFAYRDKATAWKFDQRPNHQKTIEVEHRSLTDRNDRNRGTRTLAQPGRDRSAPDRPLTALPVVDRGRQVREKFIVERPLRTTTVDQARPQVERETKARVSTGERRRVAAETQVRHLTTDSKNPPQRAVVKKQKQSTEVETVGRNREKNDRSHKAGLRAELDRQSRKKLEDRAPRKDREVAFSQQENGKQAGKAERGRAGRHEQSNVSNLDSPYPRGSQRQP